MPVSPESQTVPLKQRLRLRLPPLSLPTLTLDFILPLQLHKGGEEKEQKRGRETTGESELLPLYVPTLTLDFILSSGRYKGGQWTTEERKRNHRRELIVSLLFCNSHPRLHTFLRTIQERGKRNTEEKKWKTSKTLYFPQDDTEQKSKEDKPHGESATASLPSSKPLPRRFLSMMQRKKEELNTHRRI